MGSFALPRRALRRRNEQPAGLNPKRRRELQKLKIRDPSDLGFNLREGLPADVPGQDVQLGDEVRLCEAGLLAKLPDGWTRDVSRWFQVPNSELDNGRDGFDFGSEFGTLFAHMFLRRLGPAPERSQCSSGHNCPDIFEMRSGDFAVIGVDITDAAAHALPPDAACGPTERIVQVPRRLLVLARSDIPQSI